MNDKTEVIIYSLSTKVSVGILSPIFLVITILLYGGIIHYEKWGNDPQKRSLTNMLMGSFCWNVMALIVFSVSIGSLRICFGPLGTTFGYIMIVTRQFCILNILACLLEIIVVKILQITKWNMMANLNDGFWFLLLNFMNIVVIGSATIFMRFFRLAIPELFYYTSEGYVPSHIYMPGM